MKFFIQTMAVGDLNTAYPVGYTWEVDLETFEAVGQFLREHANMLKKAEAGDDESPAEQKVTQKVTQEVKTQ